MGSLYLFYDDWWCLGVEAVLVYGLGLEESEFTTAIRGQV